MCRLDQKHFRHGRPVGPSLAPGNIVVYFFPLNSGFLFHVCYFCTTSIHFLCKYFLHAAFTGFSQIFVFGWFILRLTCIPILYASGLHVSKVHWLLLQGPFWPRCESDFSNTYCNLYVFQLLLSDSGPWLFRAWTHCHMLQLWSIWPAHANRVGCYAPQMFMSSWGFLRLPAVVFHGLVSHIQGVGAASWHSEGSGSWWDVGNENEEVSYCEIGEILIEHIEYDSNFRYFL